MILNKVKDYFEVVRFIQAYELLKGCDLLSEDNLIVSLATYYDKGWIHYGYEDNKVVSVICAYRTNNVGEKVDEDKDGNILFVYFAVSKANDKTILSKMLYKYVEGKEIDKIYFEKNNEEGRKVMKLKGDRNVKE